jgi:AhpC/TSA family protein
MHANDNIGSPETSGSSSRGSAGVILTVLIGGGLYFIITNLNAPQEVGGNVPAPARPPRPGPQVGEMAPDIAGEDIDGKSFKLSDYRGKVVMLDFWGDW